jgi:hypothetical protein
MEMVKLIKNCIVFLMFMAFVSGCYTFNKSHNAEHNRALKKDMQLMHEDIDSFLGTAEPSALGER